MLQGRRSDVGDWVSSLTSIVSYEVVLRSSVKRKGVSGRKVEGISQQLQNVYEKGYSTTFRAATTCVGTQYVSEHTSVCRSARDPATARQSWTSVSAWRFQDRL